jgi:hypothetical protein
MTSFEPRALDLTALDGAKLDGLEVRYLVTRADAVAGVTSLGGVATLESFGVLLSDRGDRVGRAPPASFEGEVRGLVPGVFASVLGLVLLVLARRFF